MVWRFDVGLDGQSVVIEYQNEHVSAGAIYKDPACCWCLVDKYVLRCQCQWHTMCCNAQGWHILQHNVIVQRLLRTAHSSAKHQP